MSINKPTPEPPLLSVIVPCYNEERTLEGIVERVLRVKVPLEIIVVDDASTDNSRQKLAAIRPATLAQASRIPGVSPTDLQNLVLEIEKFRRRQPSA